MHRFRLEERTSTCSDNSEYSAATEERDFDREERLRPNTFRVTPDSDSETAPYTAPGSFVGQELVFESFHFAQLDSGYSSDCTADSSIDSSDLDICSGSDVSDTIRDIKCDILANWLHARQVEKVWTNGRPGEGVFVKKSNGNYAYAPPALTTDGTDLYHSVSQMNVRCAMTVSSKIIKYLLARAEEPYIQIQPGFRLQIIPNLHFLPHCQKGQSAAFIASHQMLLIWQDDPKLLFQRAQGFQKALEKSIVGGEFGNEDERVVSKLQFADVADYEDNFGIEESTNDKPRKTKLWQAMYTGLTILALTTALGSGWRQVAIQQIHEPNWFRLLFIISVPAQVWLSLFFFQAIVGNLAQMAGSTEGMYENSKYYSGKPPRRLHRDTYGASLPHVTIQMPVYKEGLRNVIEPTVQSVKQAISTYEQQGGTANIFVNDDGMQLMSADEAEERQEFYNENGIGWVARPQHDPNFEPGPERFLRRGKFKKASNMNYALRLSVRVEDLLSEIERGDTWSQVEENAVYERALGVATAERECEAWADGNIRIGDYILLIDSDTRVPADCLLEAVSEMEQSPQVAILQYSSGVMNVTNNFFENGITFFTNMIYTNIRFAVANGDIAPFVGHNAIIRWSAMQEVVFECEMDHHEKFWSERSVSEDFDMALRLQSQGYIVRLAAYKEDGYKEGVSLSVYDELARWEKYAYGCNELIFNPCCDWIYKGPFTQLFINFVFSNIPLPSKVTIMAYIGTYYALGSAWIITMLNYFLIGFFNGRLDHYYLDSFKVYFAIILVFAALGNLSLAWLRYRIGECDLLKGIMENLKWIPLMTIFLGGVSLHISYAMFCHFFNIDLGWSATSKEARTVPYIEAVRHVMRRFKWNFLFCGAVAGLMLYCRFGLEEEWQIRLLVAIWPMGAVIVNHILLPIVLNPELMRLFW
ncbi:Nn.00g014550.m01.CDS01 [Neocucurbitaria sp. VM-36]